MLWQIYLSAALRKIKTIFLCLGFFTLPLTLLPGFTLERIQDNDSIHLRVSLNPREISDLQEALKAGYQVEITYSLRGYEKSTRISSFFGDDLLFERQHTYLARWDPIVREYRMIHSSGEHFQFSLWETFIQMYTTSPNLKDFSQAGKDLYLLCQVILRPRVYNPPFQILNLLGGVYKSYWLRLESLP